MKSIKKPLKKITGKRKPKIIKKKIIKKRRKTLRPSQYQKQNVVVNLGALKKRKVKGNPSVIRPQMPLVIQPFTSQAGGFYSEDMLRLFRSINTPQTIIKEKVQNQPSRGSTLPKENNERKLGDKIPERIKKPDLEVEGMEIDISELPPETPAPNFSILDPPSQLVPSTDDRQSLTSLRTIAEQEREKRRQTDLALLRIEELITQPVVNIPERVYGIYERKEGERERRISGQQLRRQRERQEEEERQLEPHLLLRDTEEIPVTEDIREYEI